MSKRRHFEGLLEQYMKMVARTKKGDDGKAFPEFKTTFREGFKAALVALEVIDESTTELSDDMMDVICSRLEEMTGQKPPPPDAP